LEASLGELEVGADLLGATFPERGGGFRFADALRGGFGGSEGVATRFVELTLALSEDDVVVDEGLGGIVEVGPTLDGELDGVLGAALRVLRVVELGVRQGGAGAVVVEETGGDDAGRAEGGTGEETASGTGGRGGAGARGAREGGGRRRSRRGRGDAHVDARGFIRSEASGEPGISRCARRGSSGGRRQVVGGRRRKVRGTGRPDVSRGEAARTAGRSTASAREPVGNREGDCAALNPFRAVCRAPATSAQPSG